VAGAKLFFPVDVPGALFSVGDGHAAQGDGEVCGTAVETRLGIQVKFSLLKGQTINAPKARVPGRGEPGPSLMTMGISADLMTAARDAVQFMIDELGRNYGISPEIAYCLVSCAGNLQIAELVNAPNWTVACSLPESCFI
jgi:acetamidase/formamidase